MNYTLSIIAKITNGELVGVDRTVTSVVTDTRGAINSSALFVALSGTRRDGHDFLETAARNGATSFLVERLPQTGVNCSYVVVKNSLDALQALAGYHRANFKGTVVAITGSNGKTIVKEWVAQLFPSQIKLYRSPRSYNSQLGVPLALLGIEGDESVAVIEAGISMRGEMERLERIIRPTIGVLTNIGEAHGENFASNEEKLTEKLKLFANCATVIRGDKQCHATIEQHNLWLVHQIYGALGIVPKSDDNIEQVALRLEVQQGLMNSTIINDSYNNDLTSLFVALDFQQRGAGKAERVLILSDIEQSASEPSVLYGKVAGAVKDNKIDLFIGIGAALKANAMLFKGINAQFFGSTTEFLQAIDVAQFAGTSVLIKGARSFVLERIARMLEQRTHTTVLEVNLSRLTENFQHHRAMVAKNVLTMAMVKASGYGAGGVEVARALQSAGANYLAVAFADEGVTLRKAGVTMPIVVLNSDPGSFAAMVVHNLEPEIYSIEALNDYCREVRRAGLASGSIHIKLDTGMHRLGFQPQDIDELIARLKNEKTVAIASIFSHFAASEEQAQDEFSAMQIDRFKAMSDKIIAQLSLTNVIRSICNSAGTERFQHAHFEMVRLGICLYKNISTLKTRITQVKNVAAGETIGYNRRTTAKDPMKIAIIPIGYADGLDRGLSVRVGQVAIHGQLCDIVGNICMDTTIVDVTGLNQVASGDSVTIFAPAGNGEGALTAEQVAAKLGTIDYEILTNIAPRIKHIYINE